jgi:methyl-accepting chemotaxis protein
MRKRSGEVARALAEQTRAVKDVSTAIDHISRQMASMTRANREHAAGGESILKALSEIRAVTDRTADGARQSRRTADGLRDRTAALVGIADRLGRAPRKQGGGRK